MSKLKFNSPKVCSKSTTLLQCLCKHLIFTNVIITNGATGEFHCFFKVTTSDFWYWVLVGLKVYIKKLVFSQNLLYGRLTYIHSSCWFVCPFTFTTNLCFDGLSNGQFTCTLANFCQIGTRESLCNLCQVV